MSPGSMLWNCRSRMKLPTSRRHSFMETVPTRPNKNKSPVQGTSQRVRLGDLNLAPHMGNW